MTIPETATAQARFLAQLGEHAKTQTWVRLVLAKPTAAQSDVQRIVVRPVVLRGQQTLSVVSSYATRDITKNFSLEQGLALIDEHLSGAFRKAHLFTPNLEIQLTISKKGSGHLATHALAAQQATPANTAHDRAKQRWLELDRPFLTALGITTAQHALVPAMARKWKQINKFLEVFAHALASSGLANKRDLQVADFGAGKAYLTFAVHDWLRHSQGLAAQVSGIELRADLVASGNAVIQQLGLQGLHMVQGDVSSYAPPQMDVMIALHACDTATDHALHLGLKAGAQLLMCAPCCHKQIRPQLLSPSPLKSVFQHGIHVEQQAEMVTDSLRALLLQAHGYDTQVFEFVSLEHTAKNKMILAVKNPNLSAKHYATAWAEVDELKRFFGVREQRLESLLRP
jgi:protein-L-isoaspartate O-methyltransferase